MIKKVLTVVLAVALLLVFAALPASAAEYKDVREGHWAENAIDRWSDYDIITGDPNGNFRPDDFLTRREFAVILSKLFGPAASTKNPFEDVASGKWYTVPILSANAKGWMVGDEVNGKLYFRPKGYVTRQQVFSILARGLGIAPLTDEKEIDEQLSKFNDGDSVSGWARGQMAALIKLGMVTGTAKDEPLIKPKHNATRATVMVILDNLTGNGVDEESEKYNDRKQYIDKGGDYKVTDTGFVVIKTKEPVTLRPATEGGTVSNIVVAPGSAGGTLKVVDTKVGGEVLVDADRYNVTFENSQVGGDVALNGDNDKVIVNAGSSLESVTANGKNDSVEGEGLVKAVTANGNDATVTTPNTEVTARADLDEDGKPVKDKDGNVTGAKGVKAGETTVAPGTTEKVAKQAEDGGTVAPVPYTPGTTTTYRVTFDANGGKGTVPAQTVETGKFASVPTAEFTYDGYLFNGWYAKKEVGKDDKPFDFAKTPITESITLYAQWKKATLAVSLGTATATGTDTSKVVTPTVTKDEKVKNAYSAALAKDSDFVLLSNNATSFNSTAEDGHFAMVNLKVANADDKSTAKVTIPEKATVSLDGKSTALGENKLLTVNLDDAKDGKLTFVVDWADGTKENLVLDVSKLKVGCVVTFMDNKKVSTAEDEEVQKLDVVKDGAIDLAAVTYPGTVTVEGHRFGGWYKDAGRTKDNLWTFSGDKADKVTANTTLYGSWEVVAYDLSFDTDDGTAVEGQKVDFGTALAGLLPKTDPTKEDYTFGGWYTDAELKNALLEDATMPAKAVTLYAKWDPIVVDVVFYEGETELKTIQVNSGKTIPADEIPGTAKTGYTFKGWKVGNGAYPTSEKLAEYVVKFTDSQGVKVEGTWELTDFDVIFLYVDEEGKTQSVEKTAHYGDKLTAPDVKVKGHILEGWYKDLLLAEKWNFDTDTMPAEALSLIANFVEDPVTVKLSYQLDDAEPVSDNPITVLRDYTIPADALDAAERFFGDGFLQMDFKGWFLDGVALSKEDLLNTPIHDNSEVLGKWERKSYTVTLDTDGGKLPDGASPIKAKYGDDIELPAPTKEHYDFCGWLDEEEEPVKYTEDGKYTVLGDATLTADWEPQVYTIRYYVDGKLDNELTDLVEYGDAVELPEDLSKEGYTLNGWYTDKNYTNKFDEETRVASNLDLYGKWEANEYTITLKLDGGTLPEGVTSPIEAKYGTSVELPTPTKDHYVFKGWLSGNIQLPLGEEFPVTGNATLKAVWEIKKFTVTYIINDKKVATQTVAYGETTEAPEDIQAPEGMFAPAVWFKDRELKDRWYFADTKVEKDTYLYGQFYSNVVTVTFKSDLGDAGVVIKEVKLEKGTQITEDMFPDLEDHVILEGLNPGFDFDHWYLYPNEETVFEPGAVINSDVNVLPAWVVETHTVTFIVNGEEAGSADVEWGGAIDKTQIPKVEVDAENGYRFLGWYTDETYTEEWNPEEPITEDKTVYAFVEKVWTVTFYGSSADETPWFVDSDVLDGFYADFPQYAPARTGYIWAGWQTADEKEFTDETPVLADTVVYARWQPEKYTVKFNQTDENAGNTYKGAKVDAAKPTLKTVGAVVTLDEAVVAKSVDRKYYASVTANLKQEDTDKVIPSTLKVIPDNDIVLVNHDGGTDDYTFVFPVFDLVGGEFDVAFQWEEGSETNYTVDVSALKKGFQVQFKVEEDGYYSGYEEYATVLVGEGELVSAPDDPEMEGYVFNGWETDEDEDFDFNTPITEDTILYASWKTLLADVDVAEVKGADYYGYGLSGHYGDEISNGTIPVTVKVGKVLQYEGTDTNLTGDYPAGIKLTPPEDFGITAADVTLLTEIPGVKYNVVTRKDLENGAITLTGDLDQLGQSNVKTVDVRVKWLAGTEAVSEVVYEITFDGKPDLLPRPTLKVAPTNMDIASELDETTGDVVVTLTGTGTADGVTVDSRVPKKFVYYEGASKVVDKSITTALLTCNPSDLDGSVTYADISFGYPAEVDHTFLVNKDSKDSVESHEVTATGKNQKYIIKSDVEVNQFYTVTYEKDEAVFNNLTPDFYAVAKGSEFSLAKGSVATKTGSSFVSWVVKMGETTVEAPSEGTITVNNNTVITPKMGADVTAKFYKFADPTRTNGVDSTEVSAQQTVGSGALVTEPATNPTRTGYTFVKWQKVVKGADGTFTYEDFDFTTTRITADTDFVAVWTADSVNVTPTVIAAKGDATLANQSEVIPGYAVTGDIHLSDTAANNVTVSFESIVKHAGEYVGNGSTQGYYTGVSVVSDNQIASAAGSVTMGGVTTTVDSFPVLPKADPSLSKNGVILLINYDNAMDLTTPVVYKVQFTYTDGETSPEYTINVKYPDDMILVSTSLFVKSDSEIYDSEGKPLNTEDLINTHTKNIAIHKDTELPLAAAGTYYCKNTSGPNEGQYWKYTGADVISTATGDRMNVPATSEQTTLKLTESCTVRAHWERIVRIEYYDGITTTPIYVEYAAQSTSYALRGFDDEVFGDAFKVETHQFGDTWSVKKDTAESTNGLAPAYVVETGTVKVIKVTATANSLGKVTLHAGEAGDNTNTEKVEDATKLLDNNTYLADDLVTVPEWSADGWTTYLDKDGRTASGKIFAGWAKAENATTADYKAGDTVAYKDLTNGALYAVWVKPIKVTIKTDANDDEPIVHYLLKGEDYTIEDTVERAGYVLTGWTVVDAAGGTVTGLKLTNGKYTMPAHLMGGDRTFTAQWEYDIDVQPTDDSAGLLNDEKALVKLAIAKDSTNANLYNVTVPANVVIPYSEGNENFPVNAAQSGHYAAVTISLSHESLSPENVEVYLPKDDNNKNTNNAIYKVDKNVLTVVFRLDSSIVSSKEFHVDFNIGEDPISLQFNAKAVRDNRATAFQRVATFKAADADPKYPDKTFTGIQDEVIKAPTDDPVRPNFEFDGWYNGDTKFVSGNDSFDDANVTYVAKWKPVLQVNYSDNSSSILKDGNDAKLPKEFKLVKSTTDGVDLEVESETLVPYSAGNAGFSTEAVWQVGHYVALNVSLPNDATEKISAVNVHPHDGTRNSDFKSAAIAEDGKSVVLVVRLDYLKGNELNLLDIEATLNEGTPATTITRTIDLSKFKLLYTATFDYGFDGDDEDTVNDTTTKDVVAGEKIGVPETEPDREGYDFAGWFTGTAPDETQLDETTVMPASNVTYTAKWTKQKRTLTIDLAGGEFDADYTALKEGENSVDYNSKVFLPADTKFSKPFSVFMGWKVNEAEEPVALTTISVKENTTLTAVWSSYLAGIESATTGVTIMQHDSEEALPDDYSQLVVANKLSFSVKAENLAPNSSDQYFVAVKFKMPDGAKGYTVTEPSEVSFTEGDLTAGWTVSNGVKTLTIQWMKDNSTSFGSPVAYEYNFMGTKLPKDYKVVLTRGASTSIDGSVSNKTVSVQQGAEMAEVIATPSSGYYFKEFAEDEFADAAEHGITVERVDASHVKVSGKPTGSLTASTGTTETITIQMPRAYPKTQQDIPSAIFTATGSDSGTITGLGEGEYQYQIAGQGVDGTSLTGEWTAIANGDSINGLMGGKSIYIKRVGDDSHLDSDPLEIPISRVRDAGLTASGVNTYVSGKMYYVTLTTTAWNNVKAIQYKSNAESTWHDAELSEADGNVRVVTNIETSGVYSFRIAPDEALLARDLSDTVTVMENVLPVQASTVKFNTNAGSTPAEFSFTTGDDGVVASTAADYNFVRNYEKMEGFAGWYTGEKGGVKVGNSIASLAFTNGTTPVTLYAHWKTN